MPHYIQAVSIKFSGMDLDLNPFFNTDTPDRSLVEGPSKLPENQFIHLLTGCPILLFQFWRSCFSRN